MGILDDLKGSIEAAQGIAGNEPVIAPTQRIDALIEDPESEERRRRTDYAGTIWFGGRPQITNGHTLQGGLVEINDALRLPDSLAYRPAAAGAAQIQATAAIQGAMATSAGGDFQILEADAVLSEGPGGGGVLAVFLAVTAVATLPLGVAYRVTVVCDPAALSQPSG